MQTWQIAAAGTRESGSVLSPRFRYDQLLDFHDSILLLNRGLSVNNTGKHVWESISEESRVISVVLEMPYALSSICECPSRVSFACNSFESLGHTAIQGFPCPIMGIEYRMGHHQGSAGCEGMR